jgi:hypothetical protein
MMYSVNLPKANYIDSDAVIHTLTKSLPSNILVNLRAIHTEKSIKKRHASGAFLFIITSQSNVISLLTFPGATCTNQANQAQS